MNIYNIRKKENGNFIRNFDAIKSIHMNTAAIFLIGNKTTKKYRFSNSSKNSVPGKVTVVC